jgi:hypothetical protein
MESKNVACWKEFCCSIAFSLQFVAANFSSPTNALRPAILTDKPTPESQEYRII